jgi:hypothetical protein
MFSFVTFEKITTHSFCFASQRAMAKRLAAEQAIRKAAKAKKAREKRKRQRQKKQDALLEHQEPICPSEDSSSQSQRSSSSSSSSMPDISALDISSSQSAVSPMAVVAVSSGLPSPSISPSPNGVSPLDDNNSDGGAKCLDQALSSEDRQTTETVNDDTAGPLMSDTQSSQVSVLFLFVRVFSFSTQAFLKLHFVHHSCCIITGSADHRDCE